MSFWSPFDDPEEKAEYAANLCREFAERNAQYKREQAVQQAQADAFRTCKHADARPINQVIEGKSITFLCCDFCGNEQIVGQEA